MQVLTNVVNFFLGLGAPIFVPIIMICRSIMVGMKIKDAISSGITLGVAFTGMNLLISFMKDSITRPPSHHDLYGNLAAIVDGGWSTMLPYHGHGLCISHVSAFDSSQCSDDSSQQDKYHQRRFMECMA